MNYYNDNDPFAAAWLRELVQASLIPLGVVDERSILNVRPADVRGFDQCHFFAGIGGWPYALQLAGWPCGIPVWTASCPCQPFSDAGKKGGFADDRHLWPHFFRLVAECRPPVCFGEQVASKAGLEWLDHIQADLEGADYACAAVDLSAAGIGAPHIRQRLYWVADADEPRSQGWRIGGNGTAQRPARAGGVDRRMADANDTGRLTRSGHDGVGGKGSRSPMLEQQHEADGMVGDNDRSCPPDGVWRDADWLFCRDEKWRPVESGTFPLAHGIPARVGRLRGYGNAIVPQVAAQVIRAYGGGR